MDDPSFLSQAGGVVLLLIVIYLLMLLVESTKGYIRAKKAAKEI